MFLYSMRPYVIIVGCVCVCVCVCVPGVPVLVKSRHRIYRECVKMCMSWDKRNNHNNKHRATIKKNLFTLSVV